jgi:hypothetical protein
VKTVNTNYNPGKTMSLLKTAGVETSVIAVAFDLTVQQVAGFLAGYKRKSNLLNKSNKIKSNKIKSYTTVR